MTLSRRLVLGLAGASFYAGRSRAATVQPVPRPVFGAALPLSGGAALLGDESWRGILLASEAVNAAGGIAGKPISVKQMDAPDQPRASQAVNSLITNNHANIIFGSGSSALSYPASAAAELAQIPFIELTAPADGIMARGFKFLLRTAPTTAMVAALAVATIQARFSGKTLGLLFNIGATGGAIAAAALTALNVAKLPVKLSAGYAEDTADLHTQAERLKRAGVEVLLHAAGLDDALGFALATQALGWHPAALIGCGEGYLFGANDAVLGSALEGALVIGAPFYPEAAAAVQAAYMARFGTVPRAAESLTAYVGAKLVFDTLNNANGDPTKLLAALRAVNLPLGGLANGFGAVFDHSGQNTASFVTLQHWRGGVLQPVSV